MKIIWLKKAGKQILEQYNKKNINKLTISLEFSPFTETFQTRAFFVLRPYDDDYDSINVSTLLQQVLCEWQV